MAFAVVSYLIRFIDKSVCPALEQHIYETKTPIE